MSTVSVGPLALRGSQEMSDGSDLLCPPAGAVRPEAGKGTGRAGAGGGRRPPAVAAALLPALRGHHTLR